MLSVAHIAEDLDVSERTVRRIIAAGDLGHSKVRGIIRVPEDEYLAYKRRIFWPSAKPMVDTLSSSNLVDVVFSDGSRPALRKPRQKNSRSNSGAN